MALVTYNERLRSAVHQERELHMKEILFEREMHAINLQSERDLIATKVAEAEVRTLCHMMDRSFAEGYRKWRTNTLQR